MSKALYTTCSHSTIYTHTHTAAWGSLTELLSIKYMNRFNFRCYTSFFSFIFSDNWLKHEHIQVTWAWRQLWTSYWSISIAQQAGWLSSFIMAPPVRLLRISVTMVSVNLMMLGRGVYLSQNLEEASQYPLDYPEEDSVVIRVKVNVGKVKG